MTPDEALDAPTTLATTREQLETIYMMLSELARNWGERQDMATGSWRDYCCERSTQAHLAADLVNSHLSPMEDL